MKNKTLPILLVLPFAIGILSVVTMKFAVNIVSEDIVDINWDYRQNEGFKVNESFELVASPVGSPNALLDPLNALTWKINEHLGDDLALIEQEQNAFFLKTLQVGEIVLTCQNIRGTVSKSFKGYIYQDGIILINPRYSSSLGIEEVPYVGEFDYEGESKTNAKFALDVQVLPSSLGTEVSVETISNGISYQNHHLFVSHVSSKVEEKSITFKASSSEVPLQTFTFKVVKDGYNIYDYDQLLKATNKGTPQIIVQQKHFESLANTYDANNNLKRDDTTLFGHYNFSTNQFSFNDEVYRFKTTYHTKYIDDWNKVNEDKLSNQVIAGLRIRKDYYGNGFKLNGHNLTFPYETTTNNEGVIIATPNARNLFRGPLTFVALGDPTDLALIKTYGQDNVFFYVDNDHVEIRDLNLRNADFGNNLNNLNFTGTALEVNGDNVLIINSQIKNAKTGIRIFKEGHTTIKNSYLATTRQFLLSLGSNEHVKPDENETRLIYDASGQLVNNKRTKFTDYFKYPDRPLSLSDLDYLDTSSADGLITAYLMAKTANRNLMNAIYNLDDFLNQDHLVRGLNDRPIFKTNVTVEDTIFYQSGIASIAFETLFNGPFLYDSLPSIITSTLEGLISGVRPKQVGGISYPAYLELKGETNFYDYKNINSLDVGAIVDENISTIMEEQGFGSDINYTIDDVFPLRKLVENTASKSGHLISEVVEEERQNFVNIPLIYYGGGVNLSTVNTSELNNSNHFSDIIELDLLESLLNNPVGDTLTLLMQRSVLTATGFKPFNYHAYLDRYLYGLYPNIETLKNRAIEEV